MKNLLWVDSARSSIIVNGSGIDAESILYPPHTKDEIARRALLKMTQSGGHTASQTYNIPRKKGS